MLIFAIFAINSGGANKKNVSANQSLQLW